jgi:uncharacterized protein (TIGR02421 family)
MSAAKKPAEPPLGDRIAEALQSGETLRCDLGRGARLHIDRALPFIVIHRLGKTGDAARAVAAASASYLLFRNQRQARDIIAQVGAAMSGKFGAFLVIEIGELEKDALAEDADYLPPFEIELAASEDDATRAALGALAAAIQATDAKFRLPRISQSSLAAGKGARPLVARLTDYPALHIGFAPIYRAPDGETIYPDLRERMAANMVDSILQAIAAFVRETGALKPATHRALGRKVFIDTVVRADRAMDEVAQSFDFLLSVTPINAGPAYEQFADSGHKRAPRFLYRPLTASVDRQKRALYAIDLDLFEDPVLSGLYEEKRQELDLQLSMISARETPRFRELGRALYGSVEPSLLAAAEAILDQCRPGRKAGVTQVGSNVVKKRAEAMIADYAGEDAGFDARIELRDDLPSGLMVTGRRLLISKGMAMPKGRVEALLSHEVGVHLLTYFNGSAQGLRLFRSGLAGYEGLQEGLAVLAEYLVGGMTPARLRLIAARVVACSMMLEGAPFQAVFNAMTCEHGFPEHTAFTLTLRIYRGGGFAKDAVYLRGLLEILAHLEGGGSLDPFWMGKVAASHFPVIEELGSRGLLKPPRIVPRFLSRKGASERLEKARAGLAPIDMVNS